MWSSLGALQESILDEQSRRKLAVHIVASPKAAAADASSAQDTAADRLSSSAEATTAEANGTFSAAKEGASEAEVSQAEQVNEGAAVTKAAVPVQVIKDVWSFKRVQEMYSSPK